MGQICLSAVSSVLSEEHSSATAPPNPPPPPTEVIPLDKSGGKEWALCLPANLIPPLSTAKPWRQRESPGKFTKRFSPHCWLEESTAGQSPAEEGGGGRAILSQIKVWFFCADRDGRCVYTPSTPTPRLGPQPQPCKYVH